MKRVWLVVLGMWLLVFPIVWADSLLWDTLSFELYLQQCAAEVLMFSLGVAFALAMHGGNKSG